jgi:hypothetical protein
VPEAAGVELDAWTGEDDLAELEDVDETGVVAGPPEQAAVVATTPINNAVRTIRRTRLMTILFCLARLCLW